MPNGKDLSYEKRARLLHLGNSGTGKTCASLSIGGAKARVFVFDIDNRLLGARYYPGVKEKFDEGLVEYETFRPPNVLQQIEISLDRVLNEAKRGNFQLVVWSSTTNFSDLLLVESTGIKDIKHFSIAGTSINQKMDYNYLHRIYKELMVDEFNKFPCHLVVEGHIKSKTLSKPILDAAGNHIGDEQQVVGREMAMPGQLSDKFPTWFNETYEFTKDDTIQSQPPRHIVRFKSQIAKTAMRLPASIDWTNRDFWELLTGIHEGRLDQKGQEKK